jgi:hypothetical protein
MTNLTSLAAIRSTGRSPRLLPLPAAGPTHPRKDIYDVFILRLLLLLWCFFFYMTSFPSLFFLAFSSSRAIVVAGAIELS